MYCIELKEAVEETAEEGKSIMKISKKALDTAESTEMEVQKLTDEVAQFQGQTNAMIKEQASKVNGHEKMLSKHNHELQSTHNQLSVMKVKQTNVASRVTYAIQEITQLSQDQKKSSQQLRETQEHMSYITDAEKQLTEQFSELTRHLSITEEETYKQVSDLERQVSSMQQQLQETTSMLR